MSYLGPEIIKSVLVLPVPVKWDQSNKENRKHGVTLTSDFKAKVNKSNVQSIPLSQNTEQKKTQKDSAVQTAS